MKVIQLGNPILRTKSEKILVSQIRDSKYQSVINQMLETMRDIKSVSPNHGNGLAATQIGYSYQIIARFYDNDYHIMINPEITEMSEETFDYSEGCLSYFYLRAEVKRARHVTVRGYDASGSEVTIKFSDDAAGFAQHEIDHINGIPYIDRITDKTKLVSVHEKYRDDPKKLQKVLDIIQYVTT